MNANSTATVVLVGASADDAQVLTHAESTLKELAIPVGWLMVGGHNVRWSNRHDELVAMAAEQLELSGVRIVIVAAGSDATLAERWASHTAVPVLGVPCAKSASEGLDRLRGLAAMTAINSGVFMGLGKAGAINAALFTARVLARTDAAVAKVLERRRAQQESNVLSHRVVSAG